MSFSDTFILNWLVKQTKPIKAILLISILFTPLVSSLMIIPVANATSITSARDCDDNAVIRCGALTPSELKRKYDSQASVRTIFHNFGITHNDINDMSSDAVEGRVTAGGRVLVNNEEVANDAVTAGRQNIAGSQAVTANGVTFYKRLPSVSFTSSSLPAFVVMKNGQFDFAVIASCGNPVSATPVVRRQAPPPAPATVIVSPTPPPTPQTQTVVVERQIPVPTPVAVPTPVPVPQPQPRQIPNTGAQDVLGMGSFIALVSTTAHFLYKRRIFG